MTDVPVFERHRLDELHKLGAMAGMPLVSNLLTSFLGALPGKVQGIRDAVAAGDSAALKFAAHSLKSSSAQLGGAALAAVLLSLEHAPAEGAGPLLDRLDEEVARITPLFRAELDAAPR